MNISMKKLVISALLALPVNIGWADGPSEAMNIIDILTPAPAFLVPVGDVTQAAIAAGSSAAKAAPAKGGAKEITDANYKAEIELSKLPTLVFYCSPADAYCRAAEAAVDSLAKEYAGRAKIAKVDMDAQAKLAKDKGVTDKPTYDFFKGGKLILRTSGAFPPKAADIRVFLKMMIDDFLFGKKP